MPWDHFLNYMHLNPVWVELLEELKTTCNPCCGYSSWFILCSPMTNSLTLGVCILIFLIAISRPYGRGVLLFYSEIPWEEGPKLTITDSTSLPWSCTHEDTSYYSLLGSFCLSVPLHLISSKFLKCGAPYNNFMWYAIPRCVIKSHWITRLCHREKAFSFSLFWFGPDLNNL